MISNPARFDAFPRAVSWASKNFSTSGRAQSFAKSATSSSCNLSAYERRIKIGRRRREHLLDNFWERFWIWNNHSNNERIATFSMDPNLSNSASSAINVFKLFSCNVLTLKNMKKEMSENYLRELENVLFAVNDFQVIVRTKFSNISSCKPTIRSHDTCCEFRIFVISREHCVSLQICNQEIL